MINYASDTTYLSSVGDSETMQGTDSDVNDLSTLETLRNLWLSHVCIWPVTQAEVISLPPDTNRNSQSSNAWWDTWLEQCIMGTVSTAVPDKRSG